MLLHLLQHPEIPSSLKGFTEGKQKLDSVPCLVHGRRRWDRETHGRSHQEKGGHWAGANGSTSATWPSMGFLTGGSCRIKLLWDKGEGFSHKPQSSDKAQRLRRAGLLSLSCGRSTAGHTPGLVHRLQKQWESAGEGKSIAVLKAQTV